MALPQPRDDVGAARGDLGRARQALAETAKHTDDLIASLPEPGKRSAKQHATAAAAHDVIRTVRSHFMELHAEAVYDELTGHRTCYLRLPELVEAAAAVGQDRQAVARVECRAGRFAQQAGHDPRLGQVDLVEKDHRVDLPG